MLFKAMMARLRPRPLTGIAEIAAFAGKHLGTVLSWTSYVDFPGEKAEGGPWVVRKGALAKWMRKHKIGFAPETVEPIRRPKAAKEKSRWQL